MLIHADHMPSDSATDMSSRSKLANTALTSPDAGSGFSFGGSSSASQPASAGAGGARAGGGFSFGGSTSASQPASGESSLVVGDRSAGLVSSTTLSDVPSNVAASTSLSQSQSTVQGSGNADYRMLSAEEIISQWKSTLVDDAIRFEEQSERVKCWDRSLRENQKVRLLILRVVVISDQALNELADDMHLLVLYQEEFDGICDSVEVQYVINLLSVLVNNAYALGLPKGPGGRSIILECCDR